MWTQQAKKTVENNVALDKLIHWKIRLSFLRTVNSGVLQLAACGKDYKNLCMEQYLVVYDIYLSIYLFIVLFQNQRIILFILESIKSDLVFYQKNLDFFWDLGMSFSLTKNVLSTYFMYNFTKDWSKNLQHWYRFQPANSSYQEA